MPSIHAITHPNRLTESIVNYFANYYSFVVNQLGRNSDFEIDNILSVIEKIIFQLENGIHEKSMKYINNYLGNPLISCENKYFKEYKDYGVISSHFEKYKENHTERKKKEWLIANNPVFLKNLKSFKTYLKKYMFNGALKAIISYLKCSHELEEHKNDIQYYTHLIAVELFYKFKGKADIKEVFSKIMTKDIDEFPFCPKFLKTNKQNLTNAKKLFIANRTFEQQFLGIKNFLNQGNKICYYIFRVGNITCSNDLNYAMNDVIFCNFSNSKLLGIKNNLNNNPKNIRVNFFDESFQLFAIVACEATTRKNGQKEAAEKAILCLNNMNKVCDTSGFIDKHSYLFTYDFVNVGYTISYKGARSLSEFKVSELISSNAYEYLKGKSFKSKKTFLQHEKTFLQAKNTGNIDDYWKYIENLMGKPLTDDFASIVSKTLIAADVHNVEMYIKNCFSFFNTDSQSLGIKSGEQSELLNEMEKNEKFDYSSLISRINNSFLIDVIKYKEQLNSKTTYEYTKRLVSETYEQRNFIQHSGQSNEKSILKLGESTPWLFSIFRRNIIKGMIENPLDDFKSVVKLLTTNK